MIRIMQNLVRLPRRTLQSFLRRREPVYRLQTRADGVVPARFSRERLDQLNAIPGMSSFRENRLLAYLALESPLGGCVVEIGAFRGKSAAWLTEAAQHRPDRPAVVSIDPHLGDTWEAFQATAARFDLYRRGLEVHRAFSHEVGAGWTRPISFLWIDGSHEYEDVVHDIEDFVPHVLPGGWVVFDDVHSGECPGVKKALAERMYNRPGFTYVGAIKNFDLFQRNPQAPARKVT